MILNWQTIQRARDGSRKENMEINLKQIIWHPEGSGHVARITLWMEGEKGNSLAGTNAREIVILAVGNGQWKIIYKKDSIGGEGGTKALFAALPSFAEGLNFLDSTFPQNSRKIKKVTAS